jgi:molybdate transport system substrate-binding protein
MLHTMTRLLLSPLAWLLMAWAATAGAQTLVVAVDSSLHPVLKEVAKDFEANRSGVKVQWVVGAPGALLDQLAQGKPMDVWAGTDDQVVSSGLLRKLLVPNLRGVFASNHLVLVEAAAASGKPPLQRLADLALPEVQRVAMGREATEPAGRYARQAIDTQRLWPLVQRKVVLTDDVREVLRQVATAEVDAGFVYATDAAANPQVRVVQALQLAAPIRHQAHVAVGGQHAALAEAFVAHLRSPVAQAAFKSAGFELP